jgi:hypothetical protein
MVIEELSHTVHFDVDNMEATVTRSCEGVSDTTASSDHDLDSIGDLHKATTGAGVSLSSIETAGHTDPESSGSGSKPAGLQNGADRMLVRAEELPLGLIFHQSSESSDDEMLGAGQET